MDDAFEILTPGNDHGDWLREQISLMETWLKEAEANPSTAPDEVDRLRTHVRWLHQELAKHAQG